jgi:hypothetical protein
MKDDAEDRIVEIVAGAEEFVGLTSPVDRSGKPRLQVESCNPHLTVAALRDILAAEGTLYDRGVPIRLTTDRRQGCIIAHPLTPDSVVMLAHAVCRPYVMRSRKDEAPKAVDARLPRSIAVMYLDWIGEWRLPLLHGIASTPLLRHDGSIHSEPGYDKATGYWLENVPHVAQLIPNRPTSADAARALLVLRETFATFCFADAQTTKVPDIDAELVDTSIDPGADESAFLAALLTAATRSSLDLAPGVLIRAAPLSGAGSGKGLLARCINLIAFGREPTAVTSGGNAQELEKRLAAELIAGGPVLFLDNLNNTAFKSDLLASAITERPARVRILGKSEMVPLNATAFVILTGNGLSVSEDLARRFISIELDPRTEDPEARTFPTDIRADVKRRRLELLAAALTIWRWGRLDTSIKAGRPLGSFEQWCRWVRDPLVALGCRDPVDRVGEAKQRDGRRQATTELFRIWWERHADRPVPAAELHDDVKKVIDPQDRGRQFIAAQLEKLAGTRMAGHVLTRQAAAGKWGRATFSLQKTGGDQNQRDHRGHRHEVDGMRDGDLQ